MSAYTEVGCPTCGAAPGARCRTRVTDKTTDTHAARFTAKFRVRLPPVPEVCSCGNRFDGDNLCMISACEQES